MSEPLTLAEAVPLGTVRLQRLLANAGVRSLVIKGPAFIELGVRAPKQSNDVDLLIHPDDWLIAREALAVGHWSQLTFDLPPELEVYHHSRTFQHELMPSGLDLHHRVPGMFGDARCAFETLWSTRSTVTLAHQPVLVPAVDHSLVIEALNKFRDAPVRLWVDRARMIVADSRPSGVGLAQLTRAAFELDAELAVAPLVVALGGVPRYEPEDERYKLWCRRAGHVWQPPTLVTLVRDAPWRLPGFLVSQLWISENQARHWARKKNVTYKGRRQIALVRAKRLLLRSRAARGD